MAKRADIARGRFVAWAVVWAASSRAATIAERVEAGIYRTYVESERGDTGIGRVTARKLTKKSNLPLLAVDVARGLATHIIAEGA